jgi:hypothetical protein
MNNEQIRPTAPTPHPGEFDETQTYARPADMPAAGEGQGLIEVPAEFLKGLPDQVTDHDLGVTAVRRVTPVPARFGEVISIPEGEFRGDPRRVIGHPSNPMSAAAQAYVEQSSPDVEPLTKPRGV